MLIYFISHGTKVLPIHSAIGSREQLKIASRGMYTKHKGIANIITLVSKLGKEAWGAVSSEKKTIKKKVMLISYVA